MNHRGQVLISFLLMLPIFLMLFVFVVDIGLMKVNEREVENTIKEGITFELKSDEISDIRINDYIRNNLDNLNKVDIVVGPDNLKVTVTINKKSLFYKLLNKDNYTITKSYYGYVENDKIKIIKEVNHGN